MKIIKYNLCTRINHGTNIEEVLNPITMDWNEANEEIAKREAHNGEYTIEDDERPEPVAEPTDKERLEALEIAMLEMLGVSV